jgi:hypothetical protein
MEIRVMQKLANREAEAWLSKINAVRGRYQDGMTSGMCATCEEYK